jgi:hypothetical protein
MGTFGGNGLILAGIVLILLGLLAKYGLLGWFGHLPGDVHIKGENGAFYFPVTTMLLLSVVLSALFYWLRQE